MLLETFLISTFDANQKAIDTPGEHKFFLTQYRSQSEIEMFLFANGIALLTILP